MKQTCHILLAWDEQDVIKLISDNPQNYRLSMRCFPPEKSSIKDLSHPWVYLQKNSACHPGIVVKLNPKVLGCSSLFVIKM